MTYAPTRHSFDTSDFQFDCVLDGTEVVARLYFRGERFGPEFRAQQSRSLCLQVSHYLAQMTAQLLEGHAVQ